MENQTTSLVHLPFFDPSASGWEALFSEAERPFSSPGALPFPQDSGLGYDRRINFKKFIFYSFTTHFCLVLLLIIAVYHPDKRPIKEVNYWVIDLVTGLDTVPKGLKEGNSESATSADKINLPKEDLKKLTSQIKESPAEMAAMNPEEQPKTAEDLKAYNPREPIPTLSESRRGMESAIQVLKESSGQQLQLGQYLFMMRLNQQINTVKIKYFYINVHDHVAALLHNSISEESLKKMHGKAVSVDISFSENGDFQYFSITPDADPDFAGILSDQVEWSSLPPPAKFGLPNRDMKLRIAVNSRNEIQIKAELL